MTMLNFLHYTKPARNWNEALPLGNGRLGAMVKGDPQHEVLWLNEDSLWSGYPRYWGCDDARQWYDQACSLVSEGKYAEAQAVL